MAAALLEQARNRNITPPVFWINFRRSTARSAAQDAQPYGANSELAVQELQLRERRPPFKIYIRSESQWIDQLTNTLAEVGQV